MGGLTQPSGRVEGVGGGGALPLGRMVGLTKGMGAAADTWAKLTRMSSWAIKSFRSSIGSV